jgi:hypothetical protein
MYEGLLKGQDTTLQTGICDILWTLLCENPQGPNNASQGYKIIEDILKKDGKLSKLKPKRFSNIVPTGKKSLIQLTYNYELSNNKSYPNRLYLYDSNNKQIIGISRYTPFVEDCKMLLWEKGDSCYRFYDTEDYPIYELPDCLIPLLDKINNFINSH